MPFLQGLNASILQRIDEEYVKKGKSIYSLPYDVRSVLFEKYDIWETPANAYDKGISLACPICLKIMNNWSPDGKRRFIRHKPGEGNPLCEAVIKGKVYDITLGIDDLFGPDPKKKKKTTEIDIKPVKPKTLENVYKSPTYYRQNPETMINGIPLHQMMLLEGSGKEKVTALFHMTSRFDNVLGVAETNGQFIMELRNKKEQPYYEKDTINFYNAWMINGRKYQIFVDAHFHDGIEYDENGKAKERLKDKILKICAYPDQYDKENDITKIYPNRTPVLIKGIYRFKKTIHHDNTDIIVFDVDVYSDWDIYACPDDIYTRKESRE